MCLVKQVIIYLILFLIVYIIAAIAISKITVNADKAIQQSQDITVFIKINGLNTDIVVPVKSDVIDWTDKIKIENTIV